MSSFFPVAFPINPEHKANYINYNKKTTSTNHENQEKLICDINFSQKNNFLVPAFILFTFTIGGIASALKNKFNYNASNFLTMAKEKIFHNAQLTKNKIIKFSDKNIFSKLRKNAFIQQVSKKEYIDSISKLKKFSNLNFDNTIKINSDTQIILKSITGSAEKTMEEYKNGQMIKRTVFNPTKKIISSIQKNSIPNKRNTTTTTEVFDYFCGNSLYTYNKFCLLQNGKKIMLQKLDFSKK